MFVLLWCWLIVTWHADKQIQFIFYLFDKLLNTLKLNLKYTIYIFKLCIFLLDIFMI